MLKKQIVALVILLICIGTYISIKKFLENKRENSFSTLLFTSGMSLVLSSTSDFWDKALIAIGIIAQYDNASLLVSEFNLFYFFLGSFLIFLAIILHFYSKKKLYVLNMNGYLKMRVESYLPTLKVQNCDFKEREIDFINIYKLFNVKKDIDIFQCIRAEIEDKVKAFKEETSKVTKGYTGIAPIPFIMFAGTFLSRVKIDEYFEYDKIHTKTYYTLKDAKMFDKCPELKDYTDYSIFDENKTEAVVAVSLTRQITDFQVSQFTDKANVIKIGVDNPQDNLIRYKQQLDSYVNFIMDKLEQLAEDYPQIDKIHLLYSGQSCLALELGKRCEDSTRIPQIISYQFENQSPIKYPWGIVVNGNYKGELILIKTEVISNNV